MPSLFANNIIANKISKAIPLPYYLSVDDDPRPKCTLVLGDGFTQGLLQACNIKDTIKLDIESQIPAPKDALYIPSDGDNFPEGPLWDKKKWPRVFKAYEDHNSEGREFYKAITKTRLNPSRERGAWGFSTNTLAYELRCYLWHYFKFYDLQFRKIVSANGCDLSSWPWRDVLHMLLGEFNLNVISYNYDLLTENLLFHKLGIPLPFNLTIAPVIEGHIPLKIFPVNTIFIYKPHGCLHHQLDIGMGPNYLGANPWHMDHEAMHNITQNVITRIDQPINLFPSIPDIVPPGHQGDDICNPQSVAKNLAETQIRNADLIIFCGLSAAEPDTDEIRNLIQNIQVSTHAFHVGLASNSDSTNNLATLLKGNSSEAYEFVDAGDLEPICTYIKKNFELRYDWG